MEWLVFSLLVLNYLAIFSEVLPKREPRRPVHVPYNREHQNMTLYRLEEVLEVLEQLEQLNRERKNEGKVNWKKEGF